MATQQQAVSAKKRYNQLSSTRKPYVERAVKNAKLTIPLLFPDEGTTGTTQFKTPYQSVGSQGVNNLTAKLGLALMPPNTPFFRLALGDVIKKAIKQQNLDVQQSEIEQQLSMLERRIMHYMDTQQMRVTILEGLSQLIVAGNVLFFLPPKEGGMKMYRLSNYVISRDSVGNVLEIVTKDTLSYGSLPQTARAAIAQKQANSDIPLDKKFDIYTYTALDATTERYNSFQEIDGNVIAGSQQVYPKNVVPWIAARIKKADGESYGRSFIDEYYGDLSTLESLWKAVVEMAAVASFVVYLVSPNAQTRIKDLQNAQSGEFVYGKEGDVVPLFLNKTMDLQVAQQCIQTIEQRLQWAFMLNSVVQRDAERVTAEEIRYVAQELDNVVGGIYAILTQELQLPLINCVMNQMKVKGLLPDLPTGEKGVEPTIITGVEALGRGQDYNKLVTFMQTIQQTPEMLARVNLGAVIKDYASSLGLNATELIKSDAEMQAEMEQAQQAQMQQQIAPEVVRQAGQQ